jgi:hypothetical protein
LMMSVFGLRVVLSLLVWHGDVGRQTSELRCLRL